MTFPLKETIATFVTLLVALLSYRQWQRTKRSGRFLEDRETAYNAVWSSLEEAHLLTRQPEFQDSGLDAAVTRANTLLMKHGLHIAEADKALAQAYLAALRKFGHLVAGMEDLAARQEMYNTGAGYVVDPSSREAYIRYTEARAAVVTAFRNAIGAGQI